MDLSISVLVLPGSEEHNQRVEGSVDGIQSGVERQPGHLVDLSVLQYWFVQYFLNELSLA